MQSKANLSANASKTDVMSVFEEYCNDQLKFCIHGHLPIGAGYWLAVTRQLAVLSIQAAPAPAQRRERACGDY